MNWNDISNMLFCSRCGRYIVICRGKCANVCLTEEEKSKHKEDLEYEKFYEKFKIMMKRYQKDNDK